MKVMLQIEKVSKTYHSKGIDYPVLKEISATIHDGEFVAIMGPSGSGKTTLLNVISGFISADGGKVILDGQDILTAERADYPGKHFFTADHSRKTEKPNGAEHP